MSRHWTPEEDDFLVENCAELSDKEMAEHLGRGHSAVSVRIGVLRKAGRDIPERQRGTPGLSWKALPKHWDYGYIPDHIRIT